MNDYQRFLKRDRRRRLLQAVIAWAVILTIGALAWVGALAVAMAVLGW